RFQFAEPGHRIGRQLLQRCCDASFRLCPLNDNCVENIDLKQAFKFAIEEILSLVDGGLDYRVVIALEGDLRAVCLKQILVNVKSSPEYFQGCFEPFDSVFLGGLAEALVIDATHVQNNSEVTTFGNEHFIVPEAIEVDMSIECSGLHPWLHDPIQAQHQRTSTAAISCFAAS